MNHRDKIRSDTHTQGIGTRHGGIAIQWPMQFHEVVFEAFPQLCATWALRIGDRAALAGPSQAAGWWFDARFM